MNGTVFPTKTIQLCCTGILLDTINLINLIKLKQCNINLKKVSECKISNICQLPPG